jgi:hypothetical protein
VQARARRFEGKAGTPARNRRGAAPNSPKRRQIPSAGHRAARCRPTAWLTSVTQRNRQTVSSCVVPNAQRHRGAHPEDSTLFDPRCVEILRTALDEAAWLLDRGYATSSVLDIVGRRHQLHARQRQALQRSVCSGADRSRRRAKALQPSTARGASLAIDGFNLIIGLEVALSGGPLLRARDGALRDLAGLRGSYHLIEETDRALEVIGAIVEDLAIEQATFYLDRPVSNSGRLRSRIEQASLRWCAAVTVELVANPDRELTGRQWVVSSDSAVIDCAVSWFNFLGHAVETRIDTAWVIELDSDLQGLQGH